MSFSPCVMAEGYMRRRERKRVPEPAGGERHHIQHMCETVLGGEGNSGKESFPWTLKPTGDSVQNDLASSNSFTQIPLFFTKTKRERHVNFTVDECQLPQ